MLGGWHGVWVQSDGCSDVDLSLSLRKVLLSQFCSGIDDIEEPPQLSPGKGEGRWVQGAMLRPVAVSGTARFFFFFLS